MNKTYKFLLPLGIFISLLISSCELYNPAEPIPAYIHIQKIDVERNLSGFVTPGDEGTLSSKISDAWVYVDEQLIGCFELPATFPVIGEGVHKVRIRAGIKVNGIAANRSPYPFFSHFNQDVDLQIGKTITLTPSVSYLSSTSFVFMQDFEVAGSTIDTTNRSDTSLQILTLPDPNVFEGNRSAIAYVDNTRTFFECATLAGYELPTGGAPVFLEFNYKCNYQFTVSIIAIGAASTGQFTVLHLNPSSDWNKAYLYLTPNVSAAFTADTYKVAFGMINNTGADSAAMMLDNIKLIK